MKEKEKSIKQISVSKNKKRAPGEFGQRLINATNMEKCKICREYILYLARQGIAIDRMPSYVKKELGLQWDDFHDSVIIFCEYRRPGFNSYPRFRLDYLESVEPKVLYEFRNYLRAWQKDSSSGLYVNMDVRPSCIMVELFDNGGTSRTDLANVSVERFSDIVYRSARPGVERPS